MVTEVAPETQRPENFNDLPEEDRWAFIRNTIRLLHVYGQDHQHQEAEIVGNRNALIALRATVDYALEHGEAQTGEMASDGEGYSLIVRLDDKPWDHPSWERRPLPYLDAFASGRPDPEWKLMESEQLVWELRIALRQANTQLVKRGVKPVSEPQPVQRG